MKYLKFLGYIKALAYTNILIAITFIAIGEHVSGILYLALSFGISIIYYKCPNCNNRFDERVGGQDLNFCYKCSFDLTDYEIENQKVVSCFVKIFIAMVLLLVVAYFMPFHEIAIFQR